MKKLLFILLMAITATAFSQEIFYRVEYIISHDIEDGEVISETVIGLKPLITVNIQRGVVDIRFQEDHVDDIRLVIIEEIVSGRERKLDSDGDAYNITRFFAIDNNGFRCRVSVYVYEEYTNSRIYVIYDKQMFIFYGDFIMSTLK